MKNQQAELDQRALIAGPDPHRENFKRAGYKKRNDQVKKPKRTNSKKPLWLINSVNNEQCLLPLAVLYLLVASFPIQNTRLTCLRKNSHWV